MNNPLVSVFVITYNHEKYLAQALDSMLMQECDFEFEVVVGEDCSTDSTREILRKYEEKYPDIIKPIYHQTNVGAVENQNAVFRNCTGKYVAMCEGDDYWTDPLKLQKQVDFLEENHDYIAACHNTTVIEGDVSYGPLFSYSKRDIKVEDLFNGFYLKTNTLMIRNIPIDNAKVIDDTTLGFYLLCNGQKAIYNDEVMAVYRKQIGGIQSKIDAKTSYFLNLKSQETIAKYYKNKFPADVVKMQFNFHKAFSFRLIKEKFFKLGFNVFLKSFKYKENLFSRIRYSLSFVKWTFKSLLFKE